MEESYKTDPDLMKIASKLNGWWSWASASGFCSSVIYLEKDLRLCEPKDLSECIV